MRKSEDPEMKVRTSHRIAPPPELSGKLGVRIGFGRIDLESASHALLCLDSVYVGALRAGISERPLGRRIAAVQARRAAVPRCVHGESS